MCGTGTGRDTSVHCQLHTGRRTPAKKEDSVEFEVILFVSLLCFPYYYIRSCCFQEPPLPPPAFNVCLEWETIVLKQRLFKRGKIVVEAAG